MQLYIMLSRLTDEGRETVKNNPERIKEVHGEVERMGAKVLAQYALLGAYDFLTVLGAPDNETIAKVSIELGSRGTVQIQTLAATPIFEYIEKMEGGISIKHSGEEPLPEEYEEKMY
ncbi:MAG TPA: GYD domain-containing protein [Syntrophorhabdaceae bacterium]|nr:GYD domain-containing protein [Syntrophorhabdaceae bacterium]HQM82748.1 GYD domain-containing protein [Syntrophorhabdaceae bacterium]